VSSIASHKCLEESQNRNKGGDKMRKSNLLFSILAIILTSILVVSCTIDRTPDDNTNTQFPRQENRQTRFTPRNPVNPMPNTTPDNQDDRNQSLGNLDNDGNTRPINEDSNRTGNPGITPGADANQSDVNIQSRAKRIAEAAAKVDEVQSAVCVITGNTAMIGIQFNDQYKGKLTDRIKEKVEERARDTDRRINRVVVTAEPDVVSRLEEMFREIGKGRPISGFTDELNEMINRINPK
jgi:YhcN/YlaJ family sporulation lipoprotein